MKLRAVFCLGSAVWSLACGDDTAPPVVTTPGPANIVITSLSPRGNSVWIAPDGSTAGDPEPVELDCDGRLGVAIQTRGVDESEAVAWAFRTPGACGSSPNCGYLRLDFDPLLPLALDTRDACDNRTGTDGDPATRTSLSCRSGASATLSLDLSSLEQGALAGPHVIRAALFGDAKTPVRNRTGEPLATELQVAFAPPSCPSNGEGGQGGAGSPPSSAGAGGESGGG